MMVEGCVAKQACVDGARDNLKFLFDGRGINTWNVARRDAAEATGIAEKQLEDVDCLVASLPWGQNTTAYNDENAPIIDDQPR